MRGKENSFNIWLLLELIFNAQETKTFPTDNREDFEICANIERKGTECRAELRKGEMEPSKNATKRFGSVVKLRDRGYLQRGSVFA